jgi:hypothetical protein
LPGETSTHLNLADIAENDEDIMQKLLIDIVCKASDINRVLLVGHSVVFEDKLSLIVKTTRSAVVARPSPTFACGTGKYKNTIFMKAT